MSSAASAANSAVTSRSSFDSTKRLLSASYTRVSSSALLAWKYSARVMPAIALRVSSSNIMKME